MTVVPGFIETVQQQMIEVKAELEKTDLFKRYIALQNTLAVFHNELHNGVVLNKEAEPEPGYMAALSHAVRNTFDKIRNLGIPLSFHEILRETANDIAAENPNSPILIKHKDLRQCLDQLVQVKYIDNPSGNIYIRHIGHVVDKPTKNYFALCQVCHGRGEILMGSGGGQDCSECRGTGKMLATAAEQPVQSPQSLRQTIIETLSNNEPMRPQQIAEWINKTTGRQVREGSISTMLSRMKQENIVVFKRVQHGQTYHNLWYLTGK